jgi:hypothetical protein
VFYREGDPKTWAVVSRDAGVDKVIEQGDPLFGSTVTDLAFSSLGALNDEGQIAFQAVLAEVVDRGYQALDRDH